MIAGSSSVRVGAVMRRHWIVLKRAPHRWFEISFWPFMDVLLWGALGAFVAKQNETSRASTPYLLAGITLFWIFTQSQFAIALGVNEETWTRNILNVVTTPIREVEYVVGLALFGLLKTILCVLTLSAATILLFDFDLSQIGWSALPIAALLIVNGWALGLIAVGFVLRFGQSAEILIWGLNYMLMAFSGVFFPANSLPPGFRTVAQFFPTTRLFAATRAAIDGKGVAWGSIGLGALTSFVFLVLAIGFATKLLAVFRDRGYVTRYS